MDTTYELLNETYATAIFERSKTPPWGLFEGTSGRPNLLLIRYPDGRITRCLKATALRLPAGTRLEAHTGGGGGYGSPTLRDVPAVLSDIINGYISEEAARRDYAHAFQADTNETRSGIPVGGLNANGC